MRTRSKFKLKGAGQDSYLELLMAFPLASIKSEEQLQEAQKGKKPFTRRMIRKLADYFEVDASMLAANF
jgi:hypothetical protein